MDNDLNRSLRFLEDALASPGRGLFKKSVIKPSGGHGSSSRVNLSITLAPHELQRLASSRFLYDETMADLLQADKTITGGVIQNINPWKTALDNLYMEFFEILQTNTGEQNVLEILSEFARACSDALNVVRGLKSKVMVTDIKEERWLEKERDTWRLLFILYQDRLATQNLMEEDEQVQYFGKSERLCIEHLFKKESLIRECQLVIDWLESQAADQDNQEVHFSDSTLGWENTLHQLKSADTIAFGSSRQVIDKLDPDAPHYQRKPLHDLDAEDEKRLSKKVFREIRCGKLEEAQKLVRQCGHSWKAAIFEGWRLFHNPNIKENHIDAEYSSDVDDGYEEMDSNELKDVEGSSHRDIWKIMALRYCKQDYIDPYEKAAIAVFCGYINAMLPVCPTWEDNLWAYMKSMVDIRVESEIRDCCTKENGYLPLPDEYWIQRISLNDVFSYLESSKNKTVREESKEVEHIIQKYIIMDDISALLVEFEKWVEESDVNPHFLRFAAHVVLFLDQIGKGHRRDCIEKVIEIYIRHLMQRNETQLVAFYVSKLSPSNQVHLYAQYLEKMTDNEERRLALEFAEDCSLNVTAITKQIVENIRNLPEDIDQSKTLQHKLSETDKLKISSIDWLIFYESQRAEALVQTNAIIFNFLTLGKLDAAQLAFNKLPSDSVAIVTPENNDKDEELNKTIKEHLSYKTYLDAYEGFNEWFKQIKNKPVEPDPLPGNAQFPEKVAHQHRVSQYKAELERWKLTTNHLAKTAKTLLYNVLLFPEGWLVGAQNAENLRKIIIPEVTCLLYSVLFDTELHAECVQLANIIANEKCGLYKVFNRDQLKNFLTKIAESSMALTSANKDPWGNDVTV